MTLAARLARCAEQRFAAAAYATALQVCAERSGLDPETLRRAHGRHAPHVTARQAALYLARVYYEVGLRRLASAAELDVATVSHAVSATEDRRADPVLDRRLDEMQLALMEPAT